MHPLKGSVFISLMTLVRLTTCLADIGDDPSKWPGHMEAFGSKQKTVDVEIFEEWPSPKGFFQDFLDKSRPALFKGLAKRSPAYKLWDDEYLANHQGSDKEMVYCEPEKKENRTKMGKDVTFKEFIEIYHNESIYMVNGIPTNVQKDVLMPAPLRCDDTRKFMLDAVTWFSSGGTKSVIHHDDLDNINCLFRGSKDLLFVNYDKYGKYVPLDKTQGGYSSIDVEKVDYVKYPMLRHVEQYVSAHMDEGDCLFIPFKWIHQVNSKANEKGQNFAVNIWFKHTKNHRPEKCDTPEQEATIDKYKFSDLEAQKTNSAYGGEKKGEEDQNQKVPLSAMYEACLQKTAKQRANFKTFLSMLKRDKDLTERDISEVNFPPSFEEIAKDLFKSLDITKNGIVNIKDFDMADTDEHRTDFDTALAEHHERLLQYLDKYFQAQAEGTPMEKFEEQMDEVTKPAHINDEL